MLFNNTGNKSSLHLVSPHTISQGGFDLAPYIDCFLKTLMNLSACQFSIYNQIVAAYYEIFRFGYPRNLPLNSPKLDIQPSSLK